MNIIALLSCVAFASLRGSNITEATPGPAGIRRLGNRANNIWKVAYVCGQSTRVIVPHPSVMRVRICSKKSGCVESKSQRPLDNLRKRKTLHHDADVICDIDCIKKDWTGPEELLQRLTHWCLPKTGSLYHACHNSGGLHLLHKTWCAWGEGSSAVVVQYSSGCGDGKYSSDGRCNDCDGESFTCEASKKIPAFR